MNMANLSDRDQLKIQNDKGNTLLHLAAAVGWEEMCQLLVSRCSELIYARNGEGETPLFVAAHHGNLQAFRRLHRVYSEDPAPKYGFFRRRDGNTPLHSAISLQNFANEIIPNYPELITMVNEEGDSPLYVLASKPSVFDIKSTQFDSFLYRCLFVDKLKKPDLKFPESCCSPFSIPNTKADEENQHESASPAKHTTAHFFSACYATCIMPLQWANKAILALLGAGISEIREIQIKQAQHAQALEIMDRLIEYELSHKYSDHSGGGRPPYHSAYGVPDLPPDDCDVDYTLHNEAALVKGQKSASKKKIEKKQKSPLLVAAERGVVAMVEKILATFPITVYEIDHKGKNVLMVAAENRHTKVLDHLLKLELPQYMFHQVDDEGNNVLHLAANMVQLESWRVLGATRLMQWEYNWYQYVKSSVPPLCAAQENIEGKTPWQVFSATHEELVEESADWHMRTSYSYSVVAALVATVAFATSATVPGGLRQDTGYPMMLAHKEFDVFSVSSLIALCLSVTALLFFLAIMSSPEYHFKSNLPKKLLIGLTCLFCSIVSMLVSFFAGHSFVLGEKLGRAALPIYATALAAVTIFAVANLPLFFVVKINLRSLPY